MCSTVCRLAGRICLVVVVVLTMSAAAPLASAASHDQAASPRRTFLPLMLARRASSGVRDEIIVKLNPAQPGATIAAINQSYQTSTLRALAPSRGIYLLQPAPGVSPGHLASEMEDDPRLLYVELNQAADAPEAIGRLGFAWGGPDPGPYHGQYAPAMLGLPAAHALSQGAGVVVAVIDTGVQFDHPNLVGHLTATGIDFVDGDDTPQDEPGSGFAYGHGTHVAGIVRLVAPQAQIMPIRVLDTDGRGYSAAVAEAILFALENGADVINLSLGMPDQSDLLEDVVEDAAAAGVVVVAAAGNLNNSQPQYPAASECTIGVTAIDAQRVKASFASYGSWVLLSAPGVGIESSVPLSGYGVWSGASMAAPFAAGQAALLLSLDPSLTVVQVADLMGGTAISLDPTNPGYLGQLGVGQINAAASLHALLAGNIPVLGLLDEECAELD